MVCKVFCSDDGGMAEIAGGGVLALKKPLI